METKVSLHLLSDLDEERQRQSSKTNMVSNGRRISHGKKSWTWTRDGGGKTAKQAFFTTQTRDRRRRRRWHISTEITMEQTAAKTHTFSQAKDRRNNHQNTHGERTAAATKFHQRTKKGELRLLLTGGGRRTSTPPAERGGTAVANSHGKRWPACGWRRWTRTNRPRQYTSLRCRSLKVDLAL